MTARRQTDDVQMRKQRLFCSTPYTSTAITIKLKA